METANRLKMNYLTCVIINGPLVVLNIMANAFYMFCLVCPLHGERIKQPPKLLLGTLMCCTIIYLRSVFLMVFPELQAEGIKVTQISYVVTLSRLSTTVSSSVGLNFSHYTQIVPAQRALFIHYC